MTSTDSIDGPGPPDEDPKRERRMPLRRKVSLKFKEFQGFVNEYSENVSTGGMFIRTPSPQPPGTVFDFEFTLGDDYTLIHGLGEVVWVREEDEGFDHPAGMGVRFLRLDPESRKLIDRMIQERLERRAAAAPPEPEVPWGESRGPTPWGEESGDEGPAAEAPRPPLSFLSGPPDPPGEEPSPPASSPYTYARSYGGAGVARKSRQARPLLVVLLVVAALVAALAAFFLFFPETAVRLLVGGEGGGAEEGLQAVRRPGGEGGAPEGGPVEPVPRSEAGGVLEPAPEDGAEPEGPDEGEEERELGFFAPEAAPPAGEDRPPEPPPAPAPAPRPEPPPAEPDLPRVGTEAAPAEAGFSRVQNVTWEDRGQELVVTVHLDGPIEEWNYSTARIGAPPPRELVRIEGVESPFPRTSIAVGTGLLERIRVGFHPEGRRSELHVVLDLATADVELDRTEAEGTELRLYLTRR